MRSRFDKKLSNVTKKVIDMGKIIESTLIEVVYALKNKDLEIANKIILADDIIDAMEIDIESDCVNIIATQYPIASDLRRIITILRIVSDLERIADLCVNISKIIISNEDSDFMKPLIDLPKMQKLCSVMIKGAIESFITEDQNLALSIIKMDDKVDDLYEKIYQELLGMLSVNSEIKDQVIMLLLIGRYLERIADHATNVAERVIYMVSGEYYSEES